MFDVPLYRIEYLDNTNKTVRVIIYGGTQWATDYPNVRYVSGQAFLEYPEVEHHRIPIRAASLRIDLQATRTEDFLILWTEAELSFGVTMEVNGVDYFRGYLKPDGIFQDWSRTEYNLSIDAICGLGFLEDLAYVDSNGFNFTGLRKPIQIISDCLARFGNDRKIRTIANINYNGQTAFTDVLDETYLRVDRYIQEDGDTTTSCKEVLEDVLKTYGLCICQDADDDSSNAWFIYDPEQIVQAEKNTWYEYNPDGTRSADLFYSAFAFQKIGSQIDGFNPFHVNSNQRLEMRPSITGVRIYYKYGLEESLLTNENLEHNNSSYQGWTINNGTLHDFGANNKDAIIYHSATDQIVMTADAVALAQDDLITLQYQAKNITNPFTPNLEDQRYFKWRARIGTNNYIRIQGAVGVWQSQAVTNRSLINADSSITIDLPIEAVPTTGSLIIEIYACEAVTAGQGFVDFTRFSVLSRTEEGIGQPEGENHTIQIPGGTVADDVVEVANGDNPSSQYYGTIYQADTLTPTDKWTRYDLGETKPVLRLYAEKLVRMNQRPTRYFTGDVYNLLGYLRLITINNIQGKYLPLGYRYDTQKRTASIIVRQVYEDELINPIYEFRPDYGNTVKPTIIG